jgi:hypothetical protein
MAEYTRKDYMDKNCSHREYYAQFVTEGTRRSVLRSIGKDALLESTDESLNDIPLKRWDNLLGIITGEVDTKMRAGKDWPSAAGKVCIAKEAARQIIEEN